MKVLVIDDDDVARELLVSTLKSAGHDVIELPSAIGATREIFRQSVDVVVLDVMMPNISGDKLSKLLRGNSRGKSLGIVLVSSRSEKELSEIASMADADAVLSKSEVRFRLNATVLRARERRASMVRSNAQRA